MKKVLICGYYGFKNLGDEALLRVIHDTIVEVDGNAEVEALTYDINYTTNFLGIKGFSRESIFSLIKKISQVDIVIFGGGSLLQDITSSKSIMYYLGVITMSKWLGKKVGIIGNGYGPVSKSFNKHLVRRVLRKVDRITIRDQKEFQCLKALGIGNNMEFSTDLAMMLTPDKEAGRNVIDKMEFDPSKSIVGISLRPWHLDDDFYDVLVNLTNKIHKEGKEVLFIPMQSNMDIDVCLRVMNQLDFKTHIIDFEVKPEVMAGIIGQMEYLVGMRLHALIFAAIQHVPILGIEYNPKIRTFLSDAKQDLLGHCNSLDQDKVLKTHSDFVENLDSFKMNLAEYKRKKDVLSKLNYEAVKHIMKVH